MCMYTVATAVSGQNCVDTVGSLAHNNIDVPYNQTFIFTDQDYTISCEGTVIAWDICYRIQTNEVPVTFYPGVWTVDEPKQDIISYSLLQSSNITFLPSQPHDGSSDVLCQTFNLSLADQFIAPAGSVVGLYSNTRRIQPKLLRTYRASSCITTYHYDGNQSAVQATTTDRDANVGYNIAIRVHLGMLHSSNSTIVTVQKVMQVCLQPFAILMGSYNFIANKKINSLVNMSNFMNITRLHNHTL